MDFRLLGPLDVSANGRTLALGAAKERALLAVLLLHANETVSTERLIDELWGEQPPASAAKVVATYVWQLRKTLGNTIVTRSPGYAAVVQPERLDSARFNSLLARAHNEPPAEAVVTLREALELWRGPALEDVTFASSARLDVERLEDRRLSALAQRIEHELELGRHESVLAELQSLVADHPYRERFRAQLMLALYRSARQADALESYREARRLFVDELGIEPGPELQRLERAILDHDPALDAPTIPARVAASPRASNASLPRPVDALVGRKRELGEVLSTIGNGSRLVTLTGPGGSGKTRLALEAAATLAPTYGPEVFWVGLASLRDPSLVTEAIARALGTRNVAEEIGERRVLLLVDNFEHVIESAPELASLGALCPNLTLLVTSREVLRLQGEVEYAVPPLVEAEAVALFCERARVVPSPEIESLCSRLDNLPLAVELAAARAKALSPAGILDRLPQRLDLFQGGRDADPRQQTLRATLEWSHDLLSVAQRQLFARLSVFAGDFSFKAAEEVGEADIETLQSLVEKSLLQFSGARYSMLETIREFAGERLAATGEVDAVMGRLSRYLVDLANDLGAPLYLERGAEAYARLDLEHANVRAVVEWAAASQRYELVAELVAVLRDVWTSRSDAVEVRRWVSLALRARGKVDDELWPHVLVGAEQVLVLLAGDRVQARALMEEALELLRRSDPQPWVEAMCLSELAEIALQEGEVDEAREWAGQSLALRVEHSLPTGRALTNLATIALSAGDLHKAQTLFEQARARQQSLGAQANVAASSMQLAEVARRRGDYEAMAGHLDDALRRFAALGDVAAVGECLRGVAILARERAKPDLSAELWRVATALTHVTRAASTPTFPQEIGDVPELPPNEGEPTVAEALVLASAALNAVRNGPTARQL